MRKVQNYNAPVSSLKIVIIVYYYKNILKNKLITEGRLSGIGTVWFSCTFATFTVHQIIEKR
jgi:hypothetical protein